MASEAKIDEEEAAFATRIPRPVDGGTEHLESLGRFVDDLMGDSRLRARIDAESEALFLSQDEMPQDPPPSEPPPPVPGGTDTESRGT
jgi:hypothetical protein